MSYVREMFVFSREISKAITADSWRCIQCMIICMGEYFKLPFPFEMFCVCFEISALFLPFIFFLDLFTILSTFALKVSTRAFLQLVLVFIFSVGEILFTSLAEGKIARGLLMFFLLSFTETFSRSNISPFLEFFNEIWYVFVRRVIVTFCVRLGLTQLYSSGI